MYIKTHSTGSSTLTNLLHRYCENYDKECYVPLKAGKMCTEGCLEKIAAQTHEESRHFDVWPNHVVYVPHLLEEIVPGGITISVFREPFDRTMSAYAHGRREQVRDALATMKRNEPVLSCGKAGTRMVAQVPLEHFDKLDFVILTEEYNLGLVLLRRYLGWKLEDIVYTRMKDHSVVEDTTLAPLRKYLSQDDKNLTQAAIDFKKNCMGGDEGELYRRAKDKFWHQYNRLSKEERGEVDAEVKVFEKALQQVQDCCETATRSDKYCKALGTDNGKWVKHHAKSFESFMRKKRAGCVTLVPEM